MRQRIQITTNFLLYKIGQTLCVKDFSFFGELQRFQSKTYGREVQKNHPGRFCFKKTSYSTISLGIQFFSRGSPALSAFFSFKWSAWKPPKKICLGGLGEIFWGCEKTKKNWGGKNFWGQNVKKPTKKNTHLSQNMRFFRKQNPSSEIAQFTFCLLCRRD